MNTPRHTYDFATYLQRDVSRRRRRLGWAAIGATALIFAGCVAAGAADWSPGSGVFPLAAWEAGACSGLRASGNSIDDRRPIAVTVTRGNERMLFRCDPPGDGAWLPPVARVVRWGG